MLNNYIQKYKTHIAILLFLKLALLIFFPISGDEAYFIYWANNLNIGYYDHPPMIGWLIYLLQFISSSHIFFRLFTLVSAVAIAYIIYAIVIVLGENKEKAQFAFVAFLASPVEQLLFPITNDIPLMLFGAIGGYFFIRAVVSTARFQSNIFNKKPYLFIYYSLLSGVFFGLSFLSKYFAVILVIGFFIFAITQIKNSKHIFKIIFLTLLAILPFGLLNLYFNYNSCWNNIMFNFIARREDSSFSFSTVATYLAIVFYLITPWGVYFLYKTRFSTKLPAVKLPLVLILVSFGVFFVVSLKSYVGIHWFLLFFPYVFILLSFLSDKHKDKFINYSLIFSYSQTIVLLVVVLLPLSSFQTNKKFSEIVLFKSPDKVCKKLESYDNIYTTLYSYSSLLSYHCKKDVKTIMSNSKFGRFDDSLFDIRELENKEMYVFDTTPFDLEKLSKVFGKIKIDAFLVENTNFYIAKVSKFDYKNYKKYYLDVQKRDFYNIPSFLPVGKCYFFDRYYK